MHRLLPLLLILTTSLFAWSEANVKDRVVLLDVCANQCPGSHSVIERAQSLYTSLKTTGIETVYVAGLTNDHVTKQDMARQSVIFALITSADIGVIVQQLTSSVTYGILGALAVAYPALKGAQRIFNEEPLPPVYTLVKVNADGVKNVQVPQDAVDLNSLSECVKQLVN